MQVTSGIQCNLLSPSYSTIYAPQGDAKSRFVLIQLLEGAAPWEVPAGASVIIRAAKPDGTFCFYDTNEAGGSAYTISGSTVTIELVGQVLAAPGPVLMQIDFYNTAGAHLSTFTFCCQVSESVVADDDIVSSNYFSVLTATLTEMLQIEQAVKAAYGAPLVAATAAAMTDHTRVYVYTGSESGYTNGNWYYWDGSAWASGGVYNSSAVNVDSTPTEGSTNPVSSGGTYTAIAAEAAARTAADTALGDELNDVKIAIGYSNENILDGVTWVIGTVNGAGAIDDSTTNRIRTSDYIDITGIESIPFEIDSGYMFGWHFYDANKVHISSASAFITENTTVAVPTNAAYLMINVGSVSSSQAVVSWGEHVRAYKNEIELVGTVDKLQSDMEFVNDVINFNADVLSGAEWVVGTIGGSGNIVDTNMQRIRTKNYIDISGINELLFEVDSGYKFGWHFYQSDKTNISNASSFITQNTVVPVPDNAVYLMVNMGDAGDNQGDIAWGEHLKANRVIPIIQSIDIGVGENVYFGEKVDLTLSKKVFNCDIELWKSFDSSSSAYELHANQSVALLGSYMFLFGDGGRIAVVDRSTKEIIYNGVISPSSSNHQNSAQFSDVFYAEGDEFPLLFVSRCGNTVSGSGNDTCLVYRVTRNNAVFSFELIKTIDTDIRTYGNSWCVDNSAKTISMVGYLNGTYQVVDNNPICFFSWRLPTKTELLNSNTLVLKRDDCIAETSIPYVLLQSACAFGGNVHICAGDSNKQYVIIVNVPRGKELTRIPLTDSTEVEGGYVYDGKMFVTHRTNSASADSPLRIYEIAF